MNLNDPFGRVQAKRKKEYESLRDTLQEIGVNNRADAEALLERTKRRGIRGLAIIVPVTLLLALILPALRIFVLACGVLAVAWLVKTTTSSQEYVKRYIEEELGGNDESSD